MITETEKYFTLLDYDLHCRLDSSGVHNTDNRGVAYCLHPAMGIDIHLQVFLSVRLSHILLTFLLTYLIPY